jgi:hypothetical protein
MKVGLLLYHHAFSLTVAAQTRWRVGLLARLRPAGKHLLILIAALFATTSGFAQDSLDLEEIKRAVRDTGSGSGHPVLLEQFNKFPGLLSISKGTTIYYGRLFTEGYKPHQLNFEAIEFTKLLLKKKYKKAIPKGEEILRTDPANLEILAKLLVCYKETGQAANADLTKGKVDLLMASIMTNGSGESKDNTVKVVSVGDEYAVMGMLGIAGLTRSTVITRSSIFDTWKARGPNGQHMDFFVELLLNKDPVESLK